MANQGSRHVPEFSHRLNAFGYLTPTRNGRWDTPVWKEFKLLIEQLNAEHGTLFADKRFGIEDDAMPKLILKFKDRELQECAIVGFQPVTIGRFPENGIVIDNAAVSGRHARVFREGDHYVVEDLQSTNGTFVNDKRISRYTLLDGDVVGVGKHSLVFTLASGEQVAPMPPPNQFVPDIAGTSVLDPEKQEAFLASLDRRQPSPTDAVIPKTAVAAPPPAAASVRVIAGKSDQDEISLTAVTTLIGKAAHAQIRTSGWFKPKVSAAIGRKGERFIVTPIGANVMVNNEKVSGRHELSEGDLIQVSGLTLEFRLI